MIVRMTRQELLDMVSAKDQQAAVLEGFDGDEYLAEAFTMGQTELIMMLEFLGHDGTYPKPTVIKEK